MRGSTSSHDDSLRSSNRLGSSDSGSSRSRASSDRTNLTGSRRRFPTAAKSTIKGKPRPSKGAPVKSAGSGGSGAKSAGAGDFDMPRFRGGLPITIKVVLFSCLIVLAIIGVLGFFLTAMVTSEINEQIDERGITAVKMVATLAGRIYFDNSFRIVDSEDMHVDRDEIWQDEINSLSSEIPDILDVLVTDAQDRIVISQSKTSLSYGNPRTVGNVSVYEGTYSTDTDSFQVRQFETDIIDANGKKLGKARVFLKSERLNEVKADIKGRIVLAMVIGLAVAIVLSIIMAFNLTRPIRGLVKDIEIVSSGRLDHRAPIRSRDEIGLLTATFNDMTANLKAAQEAEAKKKAIEHELSIATEIQTKLLPDRIPQIPNFDIFSFYLSAKEVGGDYYDFIVVDQTHLGIMVADVSGKGIPGSMVMTMTRSLIRLASHRNISPSDTLQKVNRILAKDMRRGMFVTALYMVLDVRARSVRVCSAGHNPLVFYRAATDQVELVNPAGIALGFDKGPIFESNLQEQELQLAKGDRLVAYTDGVVEAMNEASEEFGDDRFYELVRSLAKLSSKDCIDTLCKELEAHRGKAEQSDDITITTLLVQ